MKNPMPAEPTDRDLLFGLIAVRVGLVPAPQVANIWYPAATRGGSVRQTVIDRGGLSPADVAAIDHLVARRVESTGGDASSVLEAVATPNEQPIIAAARQSAISASGTNGNLPHATTSPSSAPGTPEPTPTLDATQDALPNASPATDTSETRSAPLRETPLGGHASVTDLPPGPDLTTGPRTVSNSIDPHRTRQSSHMPRLAGTSGQPSPENEQPATQTGPLPGGHSSSRIASVESYAYQVLRLHAVGGMGQVLVARDPALGREVALKELRPQRTGQTWAQLRFAEEARITGQLEHPNIVPVYALSQGSSSQSPFYTMKFLRGRTLAAAATEYHTRRATGAAGPHDLRALLSAFVGVCNAIAYAHSRGVIHRDLKGANIHLGDYGEVIVLDWGLAKSLNRSTTGPLPAIDATDGGSRSETVAGSVLGTPAFMPPEQAEGRLDEIDERSDVYGLGAVLYEVLTGRAPFTGTNTTDILNKVLHDHPTPPRSIVPGTPRALEAICLKALAKAPADRYPSAQELTDDIQRYLADEPVTADREPFLERVGRRARRNRTLVAAVAVAVALLIPGLAVFAGVERRNANELALKEKDAREARELAEARLSQTIDTWHTQIIDVMNELNAQPNSVRLRHKLNRTAKERLTEVLAGRPLDAKTGHMLAVVHFGLVNTSLLQGQTEAAAQEWEKARQIVEESLQVRDTGVDARRDMATLNLLQGDLQDRQGNPRAALEAYQKAGEHLETLPPDDQKDPRLRLDRPQLAARQVAVLAKLGQSEEARQIREDALTRLRANVEEHPEDIRATQEFIQFLRVAADIERTDGEPEIARKLLIEARDRAEKWAREGPQNDALTDLQALIHFEIGENEVRLKKPPAARESYERCLNIRLEKAGGRSASLDRFQQLAVVYERLGDLSFEAKDLRQAETEFGEAVRIMEKWAVVEPSPEVLAQFATCLVRLGAVLQARGDIVAARAHFTRGLDIRVKIAEGDTPDPVALFALAESHWMIGDLERSSTVLDFAEAEKRFRKALDLLRKLERAGEFDRHPAWVKKYKPVANLVEYCKAGAAILDDLKLAEKTADEHAFPLLVARARSWAKKGNAAEVVATAEVIRQRWPKQVSPLANGVARAYALAAGVAKTPADRDRYSAAATQALKEATEAGMSALQRVLILTQDRDFAALRTIPPAAP